MTVSSTHCVDSMKAKAEQEETYRHARATATGVGGTRPAPTQPPSLSPFLCSSLQAAKVGYIDDVILPRLVRKGGW